MRIVSGSSSEYLYIVAVSTTDFYTRVTGLTSFGVTGVVGGSTASTAYNITVTEVNSTQMPGVYKALIADSTLTTLPSGIDSREVALQFSSTMATVTRTFELYRRTATTGATLTVNSSGEPTNVMAKLSSMDTTLGVIASKVSSIDTDIDTALSRLSSIETNTTGLVTRLSSVNTNVDAALTKLTSIETNTTGIVTKVSSIDTKVTAIQAQTTNLTFTQTGVVDANIQYVNDILVNGVGSTANPWGP